LSAGRWRLVGADKAVRAPGSGSWSLRDSRIAHRGNEPGRGFPNCRRDAGSTLRF